MPLIKLATLPPTLPSLMHALLKFDFKVALFSEIVHRLGGLTTKCLLLLSIILIFLI